MKKHKKSSGEPAGKRRSGDPRLRARSSYSEERATRVLLAHTGQLLWEGLDVTPIGAHEPEDREAMMLLLLLISSLRPPKTSVLTFRGDLLEVLTPLSPSDLADRRRRLEAFGLRMEREGAVESWSIPRRVRTVLALLPLTVTRSLMTELAQDRGACLAMLALAGGLLRPDGTAILSYGDLAAAAHRSIADVLDLEGFLVGAGVLNATEAVGEGLTRWHLAPVVLA